jgi:hypothetical protein
MLSQINNIVLVNLPVCSLINKDTIDVILVVSHSLGFYYLLK